MYLFVFNIYMYFRFATIFDQFTKQNTIFDTIAKPVINSVLHGYNGTIFAYGQTGSGKTYSITGSSEIYEERGLIPRTIQHVFQHIHDAPNVLYNIYISYLEIYNEVGYDLLNPKHHTTNMEELPRITILEDAKGESHIRNLNVMPVASEQEAMRLLFLGDTNRTIAETPMNLYSSRSHCIFTIYVSTTMTVGGRVRRSKLHLVDLAGSERIQKSTISGTNLLDARQINLSLHYLEQVIIALSETRRSHVPYRNSMMTTVLKDSLGGNCLTAMLATLSVEKKNFEETISTCKFAQRVALVGTDAYINEEEDPEQLISTLKLEIQNLKEELALYKGQNSENHDPLNSDQIEDCNRKVRQYIESSSTNFPSECDARKLQMCLQIMKKIILSNHEKEQTKKICENQIDTEYTDKCSENEKHLSLLISLLQKEKDTKSSGNDDASNVFYSKSGTINTSGKDCLQYLPEQDAFKIFMSNVRNRGELDSCASTLRQKYQTAKIIVEKLDMCKQNIVNIKKRLNQPTNYPANPMENLTTQLRTQQDIYREYVLELQNVKTETDHLKHGFEQARLRVLHRFKKWWQTQNKPNPKQVSTPDTNIFNYTIGDIPKYKVLASNIDEASYNFRGNPSSLPQCNRSSSYICAENANSNNYDEFYNKEMNYSTRSPEQLLNFDYTDYYHSFSQQIPNMEANNTHISQQTFQIPNICGPVRNNFQGHPIYINQENYALLPRYELHNAQNNFQNYNAWQHMSNSQQLPININNQKFGETPSFAKAGTKILNDNYKDRNSIQPQEFRSHVHMQATENYACDSGNFMNFNQVMTNPQLNINSQKTENSSSFPKEGTGTLNKNSDAQSSIRQQEFRSHFHMEASENYVRDSAHFVNYNQGTISELQGKRMVSEVQQPFGEDTALGRSAGSSTNIYVTPNQNYTPTEIISSSEKFQGTNYNTPEKLCSNTSNAQPRSRIDINGKDNALTKATETQRKCDIKETQNLTSSNTFKNNYFNENKERLPTSKKEEVIDDKLEVNEDYLKNIPLTGDPEVDEEILSFYRSKLNITCNK